MASRVATPKHSQQVLRNRGVGDKREADSDNSSDDDSDTDIDCLVSQLKDEICIKEKKPKSKDKKGAKPKQDSDQQQDLINDIVTTTIEKILPVIVKTIKSVVDKSCVRKL